MATRSLPELVKGEYMKISNVKHPVSNKSTTPPRKPDGLELQIGQEICNKASKGFKFITDHVETYISGH